MFFPRDESKYYNKQSNGLLLKENIRVANLLQKGRTPMLYHLDREDRHLTASDITLLLHLNQYLKSQS